MKQGVLVLFSGRITVLRSHYFFAKYSSDRNTKRYDVMNYDATVVITTKNRKQELRKAVSSVLIQEGVQIEVIVIDDGSTDGTMQMVQDEFPTVILDRQENSLGIIVERNRAARIASAPIIFSLDDDAIFSSPHVVRQTLNDFIHHRIGGVAIPWINIPDGPNAYERQRSPDSSDIYCTTSYTGMSHAVHKDIFLRLGGYREYLFHGGEEAEYCIRMLAYGYVVALGNADPVHHFESSTRNLTRQDYFCSRSALLNAWYNVPMPYFPVRICAIIINAFRYGFKLKRYKGRVLGIGGGFIACIREIRKRKPVSRCTYKLFRNLRQSKCMVQLEKELEVENKIL